MIYGYARVSTGAQDLTGQLVQLKAAGCEKRVPRRGPGLASDHWLSRPSFAATPRIAKAKTEAGETQWSVVRG